ncbi:MAG: tetratricopeptide repeat protein, partial [Burkholderiaceae bacterium]|nr:tetratricopeptide repeat protein [Burkholderiaceae bacterium]
MLVPSYLIQKQKRALELYTQGCYQEALDICLQVIHDHPDISDAWTYAAFNCGRLNRWQEAIRYGQGALTHGANTFAIYDILARGYGELKQWDKARHYGLQALEMRDRLFGGKPVIPLAEPGPMPPLPSTQTR